MATKKKAAPRKRSAKPKAAEPLREVAEPKPPAESLMKVVGKPHFTHVPAQPFLPANGTLLRADGDPVVYVMDKGQRRPFADLETFHACCGGGATITALPPKEIDLIPVGEIVTDASDLQ